MIREGNWIKVGKKTPAKPRGGVISRAERYMECLGSVPRSAAV